MMMHVRDCPGTTSSFDVCPFPWCRKVKHLLYHLVSCPEPDLCDICSPTGMSQNLSALRGLNEYRLKKRKDCMVQKAKAASKLRQTKATKTASAQRKNHPRPATSKASTVAKGVSTGSPKAAPTATGVAGASKGQSTLSKAAPTVPTAAAATKDTKTSPVSVSSKPVAPVETKNNVEHGALKPEDPVAANPDSLVQPTPAGKTDAASVITTIATLLAPPADCTVAETGSAATKQTSVKEDASTPGPIGDGTPASQELAKQARKSSSDTCQVPSSNAAPAEQAEPLAKADASSGVECAALVDGEPVKPEAKVESSKDACRVPSPGQAPVKASVDDETAKVDMSSPVEDSPAVAVDVSTKSPGESIPVQ